LYQGTGFQIVVVVTLSSGGHRERNGMTTVDKDVRGTASAFSQGGLNHGVR
jgi:hypothetical protein